MINKSLHIALLVLLLFFQKLAANPWTVTPTSVSQTVILKYPQYVFYDSKQLEAGDVIGFFYDQSGTWVCGGYYVYDMAVTSQFTIYGNDATDNGFQPFENVHLKFWKKSRNCIISSPFAAMHYAQFHPGGVDTLLAFNAKPIIVEYPKSYYCTKNTSITFPIPLTVTNTTYSNLNILFQAGFPYNPVNGSITSMPNVGYYNYEVIPTDGKCTRSDYLIVLFDTTLNNTNNFSVVQPDCINKKGTFTLDTSAAYLKNGTSPFVVEIKQKSSGLQWSNSSGVFTDLDTGKYSVMVQDFYACHDDFNFTIQPIQENCDTDKDILTPLINSEFASIFVPWSEEIKIYNANGFIVNQFTGPMRWYGQDTNGNNLPTGVYFIFADGVKKKEITIIY